MVQKVSIAGITGWAGSALAKAVITAPDMKIVSGLARSSAGESLKSFIEGEESELKISGTIEEVLSAKPDVLVEYTKPDSAKKHILSALEAGANVVVGTSGLSSADYEEIAKAAEKAERGVLAAGNFAITVVLLQKFAEMAAKYIPNREIIDYAHAGKVDAPSGTARELAHRLSKIGPANLEVPIDETRGEVKSRGASLEGTQVHSLRLPGYTISLDAIFGLPDQKLTLRHEAGTSAEPYVEGAMLAIRKVGSFVGLKRGLDSVMDFD